MTLANASRSRSRRVALVLTAIAGFVDALAYLALYRIYVANMSGNTISVAIDMVTQQWRGAIHRFVPIAAFVIGLVAGDLVIEIARRAGMRRLITLSLSIEAVCLIIFLVCGLHIVGAGPRPSVNYGILPAVLVALAAAAMGAQTVSIRAVAGLFIFTTHVTGTLTALGSQLVRAIVPGGKHSRLRLERGFFLFMLWVLYLIGAGLGAWGWMRYGLWPLIGPLVLLLGVIALDLIRPIGTRR
jgi:uncharacterized membrane protein YoaK (UPF0700 family)